MPIAINLIKAGFKLQVYARSLRDEKSQFLKLVKTCKNSKEVATGTKYLLLCVTDDEAVEEVLFGENGAFETLANESIIIDFSTISPAKARSISDRVLEKDIIYIDAPVTGGTEGAISAELTVFLGCKISTKERISPILNSIASRVYCFESVGKGQEVKAINQVLIAGIYSSLSEAIALGEGMNLPMEKVVESLKYGAAGSWALSNRSNYIIKDKYPLGFKLELHFKDLGIAINISKQLGLKLPILSAVSDIESNLIQQGYGDQDISVLRRSIIINKDKLRNND